MQTTATGDGKAVTEPTVHTGSFGGPQQYRVEVPANWDGTVLMFSHHYRQPGLPCPALVVPSSEELGPRMDGETLRLMLLERGWALCGTASTTGWPLEETLRDQVKLHDWFAENVGTPKRSYVWGASPGGLTSITLAQLHPHRFQGALSLSADASGVINQMLIRLDIGYAINVLLNPAQDLELGLISDPEGNMEKAYNVIAAAAEGGPLEHARLILAGAVANVSPTVDSFAAKIPGSVKEVIPQLVWMIQMAHGSITYGPARKEMEIRCGGNPMWNDGVDYRELFNRSCVKDLVERAYAEAGADLEADLDKLNAAPRIKADKHAVDYLIRTGGFTGVVTVPVITAHAVLDGTTPTEHERTFADRVKLIGNEHLLRQFFMDRSFSMSYSPAEVAVLLDLLDRRVTSGEWGDTSPEALNDAVNEYPEQQRRVYNFWIQDISNRWGVQPGGFTTFEPQPLPRTYPF